MKKSFMIIVCFIFFIVGIVYADNLALKTENPASKDACSDIGRYQLFQGTYKTFDLKNGQTFTSDGIFLLDTKTGVVKRYLNKIDEGGNYIETWIPTEVKAEKKQEGK